MKKVFLKGSWIIKAPREEVYKIMSDFENMPKHFPAMADSIRVIKREENNLSLEAQAKTFGRTISVHMETRFVRPLAMFQITKAPSALPAMKNF